MYLLLKIVIFHCYAAMLVYPRVHGTPWTIDRNQVLYVEQATALALRQIRSGKAKDEQSYGMIRTVVKDALLFLARIQKITSSIEGGKPIGQLQPVLQEESQKVLG